MAKKPEEEAREIIDRMLDLAGWAVQDFQDAHIHHAYSQAHSFPRKRESRMP